MDTYYYAKQSEINMVDDSTACIISFYWQSKTTNDEM